MAGITAKTSLTELAATVSEALRRSGIVATLSGGAAVSIYSEDRYQSEDLDFVTVALIDDLKAALEPLEFKHTGSSTPAVDDCPYSSIRRHAGTSSFLPRR